MWASLWLPTSGPAQTPSKKATTASTAPKADPVIEQLVEAHNQERAMEKLSPLKLEGKLTDAALGHAKDMAEHGVMSHDGSDESTPSSGSSTLATNTSEPARMSRPVTKASPK